MCICCLKQDGEAPLQMAIRHKSCKVVHQLMVECNQQTSHLSQVSNYLLYKLAASIC